LNQTPVLCAFVLAIAAAGLPAHASSYRTLDTPAHRAAVDGSAVWMAPLEWIEHKITIPGSGAYDGFGHTMVVDGNTAFIAAPNHPATGADGFQGAVYVFVYAAGEWSLTQTLVADDAAPGDAFGTAIALQGSNAIITSSLAQIGNFPQAGAAYVFHNDGTTWSQVQKLTAGTPQLIDNFGDSVALDGTRAIIGASSERGPNGEASVGAAYVFEQSGGSWTQTQRLTAIGAHERDMFGIAVGLHGDTAFVGASQATWVDGSSGPGPGRVHVFTASGSTWTETDQLEADDGVAGDYFGEAMVFDGETLLIGAPAVSTGGSGYQGAAYVFTDVGGSWTQGQKLFAEDAGELSFFGRALAVSGTHIAMGAPGAVVGETPYVGTAYVFTSTGGTWSQTAEMSASDGIIGDYLGWSVALFDNGNLLTGAPHELDDGLDMPGAVYAYSAVSDVIFADGFDTAVR
jgi:hypothetical protein